MQHAIKKPGMYILSIANNFIAEDKTTGDYSLVISVKDERKLVVPKVSSTPIKVLLLIVPTGHNYHEYS
jgi:hypothetical protein